MKKVNYIISTITLLIVLTLNVSAASLDVSCPSSVEVGQNVTCTVKGSNNGGLAGIEGSISYSGMTYKSVKNTSGSDYLNVTASSLAGAFDMTSSSSKNLAEYTFLAESVGTAKVTTTCSKMTDSDFNTISCSGTSASITIKAKEEPKEEPKKEDKKEDTKNNTNTKNNTTKKTTKKTTTKTTDEPKETEPKETEEVEETLSSDTSLKDFEVVGYQVVKQSDGSYILKVDSNVEEITINAITNDEKATIEGLGVKTLTSDNNTFTITVTAEDGTVATYNLTIERENINKAIFEKPVEEEKEKGLGVWLYFIIGIIIFAIIFFIIILKRKKAKEEKKKAKK